MLILTFAINANVNVSFQKMLANNKSTVKFAINRLESCSNISLEKWKLSLTMVIIEVRNGTRNLVSLCVGVFKADRMDLRGRDLFRCGNPLKKW